MDVLVTIVGGLLLLGLLGWLHLRFWTRRLTVDRPYDEVHFVSTRDGARLALHRYRAAAGSAQEGAPPVILCHGIAANRYNLDLDDEHSLARFFQARGRDVWLLELRGHGESRAAARRAWGFDELAREDVPAALAHVGAATGAGEIDWVGYSLGGLVAYAFLGSADASRDALPPIRRLVTIGSPVLTRPGHSVGILSFFGRLLRRLPRAPLRGPSRFFAFAAAPLQRLAGGVLGARGSTAAPQLRRAMVNIVTDIRRGLAGGFRDWMERGAFDSADRELDYAAGMARIRTPALVIGGRHDRIAPRGTVRAGYEKLGSPEKHLLFLGRSYGHRADYGHIDLAFGVHAPEEVYPVVADWCDAGLPPAFREEETAGPAGAQNGRTAEE